MSFVAFAREHGLIMDHAIADARFHRVRTEDKPKRKNGAYIFMGERGAVRNFATMIGFASWRSGEQISRPVLIDIATLRRNERLRQEAAREQAAKLISQCERGTHTYLAAKGFPGAEGLIHPSGDLIIPMRDCQSYEINSAQRISADGTKLFLPGGKAKGSIFILGKGARGERFLVEGYATGLSVQTALIELRKRCEVWVCFSAGNLVYVSQFVRRPAYVVADNDASFAGLKAAKETGLPYVVPDTIGWDANDVHQNSGIRSLVELLLRLE